MKHKHSKNPLKIDPTRTLMLRKRFMAAFTKRFRKLKGKINEFFLVDDVLGLKGDNKVDRETFRSVGDSFRSESSIQNTHFKFATDQQKIAEFERYLKEQVDALIVTAEVGNIEDAYWHNFVQESHRKGAGRAFDDVNKSGMVNRTEFFDGTKSQFLNSGFNHAVSIEKVKLLAGRVLTELRGVTEAMSQQMIRELTDGIAQGMSPFEVARNINNRVDKIGITRARTIARTETIRAHAEGQLDSLELQGVEKVGVAVEWSTAGDVRVCPLCQPMEGVVLSIKEGRGLLPRHANCRCSFIPANVGEDVNEKRTVKVTNPKTGKVEIKQVPTKRDSVSIKQARDASVKAEIPKRSKRTIAEQKERSNWSGAKKSIKKTRPKNIFEDDLTPPTITPPAPKPTPKPTPAKLKPQPKPVPKPQPKATLPPKAITKLDKPKVPSTTRNLDAALSKAESEIQHLDTEVSYIFDKQGNIKLVTKGEAHAIDFDLKALDKMEDAVTLHNHPSVDGAVTSFSGIDIEQAIQTKQFATKVITEQGHKISMSYGKTLDGLPLRERMKFGRKVARSHGKEMSKQINSMAVKVAKKEMTAAELAFESSHEAWKVTAKRFKFDYKVEFPKKSIPKVSPKPTPKPVSKTKVFKSQTDWENSLTTQQRKVVRDYTDNVTNIYEDIRDCKQRKINCSDAINRISEELESVLKTAPKQTGIETFRGMSFESDADRMKFVSNLQKSSVLSDKSFMSTSLRRETAENFSEDLKTGVILRIKGKSGVSIKNLSKIRTEEEVLFSPNTKFKVNKITTRNGKIIVRLEEI